MAVVMAIDQSHANIRGKIRDVRLSRLRQVYEVVLSDGRTLELFMSPPPKVKLLRAERTIINSEAVVIGWLSTFLSRERALYPGSAKEEEREDLPADDPAPSRSSSSPTDNQQVSVTVSFSDDKSTLSRILPTLIHHSSAHKELGGPYNIYEPRRGTPIASLSSPLTKRERADIDLQLGTLTRQVAAIKSPTGRFGYAISVLASSRPASSAKYGGQSTSPPPGGAVWGSRTWSAAFHLMFEGLLRDSEDMAITLAYPAIRKHVRRLSYLLDEVTEPSLVFLDGMDDANVLVSALPRHEGEITENSGAERGGSDSDEASEGGKEGGKKATDTAAKTDNPGQTSPKKGSSLQIVGLCDWSNSIFGDPLLAKAFSNNPSPELLSGFYPAKTGKPSDDDHQRSCAEAFASSGEKLLLYQAYHATVSLVTEVYRPRKDSRARELAARKRLTEILAKLEEIADDPKGTRHRRPSGAMSPAKKMKYDEEEKPASPKSHEATP